MLTEYFEAAVWVFVKICEQFILTSFAMVVMKAGGLAVAIRDRAWRAERAESAGGLRGKPTLILLRERVVKKFSLNGPKYCFKIQNTDSNSALHVGSCDTSQFS